MLKAENGLFDPQQLKLLKWPVEGYGVSVATCAHRSHTAPVAFSHQKPSAPSFPKCRRDIHWGERANT